MAALTTASSAIFALVTASSAIETVPNSPPNVSSDTSFKFVPSAYAANILEEFVTNPVPDAVLIVRFVGLVINLQSNI